MTMRTRTTTVTFSRPFILEEGGRELPAGAYCVETDEVLLEGISRPVYRRVLTVLRLPGTSGVPGLTRAMTINPDELDAALARDVALAGN
jgi:hypothetical protein